MNSVESSIVCEHDHTLFKNIVMKMDGLWTIVQAT